MKAEAVALLEMGSEGGTVVREIVAWLRQHSYTDTEAASVVNRLHEHPDLWQALCDLVHSGAEPMGLTAAGVSYASLKARRWMTPINALLTLAWLRVEPKEAKKALEYGIK